MARSQLPVLLLALAVIGSAGARDLTLHVAPGGNDLWSGALPRSDGSGTNGPLASLSAALKLAREARKGSPAPAQITILMRGGTYEITEPIVFRPEDSGSGAGKPFVIAAFENEKPILSGGRRITGWKRSAQVSTRWQATLPATGNTWYFRQLFINGQRATRARDPNHGFFTADGGYLQENPVKFKFRAHDLKPALVNSDAELIALHSWIDLRQPIRELDAANRVVTLAGRIHSHTKEPNARYYIENSSDALDQAGEWHLDRHSGRVTILARAGEDLSKSEVIAPVLASELIRFEGDLPANRPVRHVVLRGLTFAHTDWTLATNGYLEIQAAEQIAGDVYAEGAVECAVEGCTFTHLGGYGLELGRRCQGWRIVGNEFVDLGAGGIRIGERGRRPEAFEENFGHEITDNHLHQLGRVYAPAVGIIVFQSGRNRIAHNHIHDLFYTAISLGWSWGYILSPCRENIVEFNHLHDIGQGILSDMGAVYTLGIQKGTVIRNNLIHHVNAYGYGGWGLYTDEGSTGIVLENNVVYRCKSAAFHQHYGRDNIVRNNVLAFGREYQLMRTRAEEHNSFTFERNLVYFDSGELLGSNWENDRFTSDHNLFWDTRSNADKLKFKQATLAQWRQRGHDRHSVVADPLFVAPARGDFRLRRGSPAPRLGFKPIDLADVGVRKPYKKQVRDTE